MNGLIKTFLLVVAYVCKYWTDLIDLFYNGGIKENMKYLFIIVVIFVFVVSVDDFTCCMLKV